MRFSRKLRKQFVHPVNVCKILTFLIQLFYGVYMSVATFVWFALLGSVLTLPVLRSGLDVVHVWAERVMGVVLIALGIKVALSARD